MVKLKKINNVMVTVCHGTAIQTGMKCKKIPCYVPHSACRWRIVKKKPKYFEVM